MKTALAFMLEQAHDIEVAVSSAQIVSAVGILVLTLLTIIGWLIRAEWKSVGQRLQNIETNTNDLPALKVRVEKLEEYTTRLGERQHKIANYVNRALGRIEAFKEWPALDLDKEE